jgi:hypothetical protein
VHIKKRRIERGFLAERKYQKSSVEAMNRSLAQPVAGELFSLRMRRGMAVQFITAKTFAAGFPDPTSRTNLLAHINCTRQLPAAAIFNPEDVPRPCDHASGAYCTMR